MNWLVYVMAKRGELPASDDSGEKAALPDRFARLFPVNGIWRARRGPLSVTMLSGTTRLLALHYGEAEPRAPDASRYERLKQPLAQVARNPGTIICHLE